MEGCTVHPSYKDVSLPQSQIDISKVSIYPERFTEGAGIIESMGSNRNKEDIILPRIVITRVYCTLINVILACPAAGFWDIRHV